MTPDQQALVGLAEEVLRGRTSPEQLAATEESTTRVDAQLWAELARAGLVGIAVPEPAGGGGLGLTELCLLLEAQGRRLAPVPLWETALLGALPLACLGGAEHLPLLAEVAAGRTLLSGHVDLGGAPVTSRDEARLVPHGHVADHLVTASPDGLELRPLDGVTRTAVETTTRALAADLDLTGVPAVAVAGPEGTAWLAERARVGLAALALGAADKGVREAAAYLSGREQFGRPLGTFQAVSQQLADCYCDVQAMRATLWQAAWALDHAPAEEARRSVAVATWWATEAGARVQNTVAHLHGGIGADVTYPVHRRLLWGMRIDALLGGPGRQLNRLGQLLAY